MRLLIVRHADPDYSIDSLTEKGWREAEYLAERLAKENTAAYYVSPLGRAKATASLTLQKVGRTAEECDWLREFHAPVHKPNLPGAESIPWDWLPQDWLADERFLQPDAWQQPEVFCQSGIAAEYAHVTAGLDALLARHGYEREQTSRFYRPVRPNQQTVVLFCHFGVECVLLSHLLHSSPMVLWHGTCAAPSSVTILHTEERRPGAAVFRMAAFGDTSHLYLHNEPPAFSARFCEVYGNGDRED